ncbi:MAG: Crp/Fnr family transcriptional regulator [Candidatus Eisenbacteria bacterium]
MSQRTPLRRTALFQKLDDTEARALEKIATVRKVEKGAALFQEGDPATGIYVLLDGRMKIAKETADGKVYVLHFVAPGQLFAEAAAFELGEFPASAIALEPSEVAFFPRSEFLELIREHPMISLKVISGLSRWIREFMERIEELATKDVSARLARFLVDAAEKGGSSTIDLDIPKAELAASLGTVGETLSRALRRFRESGWIEVDGSRIEILDSRELRSVGEIDG